MQAIDTFIAAGLRPKHLSPILGISRVTASIWLNGHGNPHVLLHKKVANLAHLVSKAVDSGKLPIPADVSKSDEVKYLQTILSEIKTS